MAYGCDHRKTWIVLTNVGEKVCCKNKTQKYMLQRVNFLRECFYFREWKRRTIRLFFIIIIFDVIIWYLFACHCVSAFYQAKKIEEDL